MSTRRRRRAEAAVLPPETQEAAVRAMLPIILAKAIGEALSKGYIVQLLPGGDPHVWRELAERAFILLSNLHGPGPVPPPADWHEAARKFRDDYNAAVTAYTLQTADAAPPTQPEGTK